MGKVEAIYTVLASRSKRWAGLGQPCAMRCTHPIEPGAKVQVRIKHGEPVTAKRYTLYHWGCRPEAVDREFERVRRQVETGTHWSQKISRN